jgi:hypothetical protein
MNKRPSLALHIAAKKKLATIAKNGSEVLAQAASFLNKQVHVQSPPPETKKPVVGFEYLKKAKHWQHLRKKADEQDRVAITRKALEEYRPIIEEWLEKHVIPEQVVYVLALLWAIDDRDFELVIRMVDNAIANKSIDMLNYVKRDMETFTVSEIMKYVKEECVLDYQPKKKGEVPVRFIPCGLPDYFFTVANKVFKGEWNPHRFDKCDVFNIAGDFEIRQGNVDKCKAYWEKSVGISSTSGREKVLTRLKDNPEKFLQDITAHSSEVAENENG